MTGVTLHTQKSILLALLELGVGTAAEISTHADLQKASMYQAINKLLVLQVLHKAPADMHQPGRRAGCMQYGLTRMGIKAAMNFEQETER